MVTSAVMAQAMRVRHALLLSGVLLACSQEDSKSPEAKCGELRAEASLNRGDELRSCSGEYTLMMQTDGNLVLYRGADVAANAQWATGTYGRDGAVAVMQKDGNFVLYNSHGQEAEDALWSSKTNPNAGAFLKLEDSGELKVLLDDQALWTAEHGNIRAAGGGSSGGGSGCTADADCGHCERCERTTGSCLSRISCQ